MSSSAFSPHPPYLHHHTIRIPKSRALSLLTAYLITSIQDASLHPNALLAESGPKAAAFSSTSTGHGGVGGGGLVLHNLRRVEAGLRGEYLGADAEVEFRGGLLEEKEGDQDEEGSLRPSWHNVGVGEGNAAVAAAGKGGPDQEVDGEEKWQDREEFEREQVVVGGGGALGEKGMEVERRDREVNEEVPRVRETKSSGDKERKRRKKEGRKKERKEAEVKRQQRGRVKD